MYSVYIFKKQNLPYIKIGISNDVEKRKATIENSSGDIINILFQKECLYACEIELELHEYFSSKRQKGEWFYFEDTELEYLLNVVNNVIDKHTPQTSYIERELIDCPVKQRTKDSYFALKDILRVIKKYKAMNDDVSPVDIQSFTRSKNAQRFMQTLQKKVGEDTPILINQTKTSSGWVHPLLGIKLLTYFSPEFEIQVYEWLLDSLIKFRIDSSDSYLYMCGAIQQTHTNTANTKFVIMNAGKEIKRVLQVEDWNTATQEKLQLRDELQKTIADFVIGLNDAKAGIKLGIEVFNKKHMKEVRK